MPTIAEVEKALNAAGPSELPDVMMQYARGETSEQRALLEWIAMKCAEEVTYSDETMHKILNQFSPHLDFQQFVSELRSHRDYFGDLYDVFLPQACYDFIDNNLQVTKFQGGQDKVEELLDVNILGVMLNYARSRHCPDSCTLHHECRIWLIWWCYKLEFVERQILFKTMKWLLLDEGC